MTTTPEEPSEQEETGLPTAPDEVEAVDEGDGSADEDDNPPVVPINTTNG